MTRSSWLSLAAVAAICLTGCNSHEKSHLAGGEQRRNLDNSEVRDAFTYMVDNAMWSNMAISDVHFVPHTAELNGAGTTRLERLAFILNAYGGTLRYETQSTDEDLVDLRMKHAHEYLALAGCDTRRVRIEAAISGGPLNPATDAIRIWSEGTVNDHQGSDAGGSSGGMTPGSMASGG